HRFNDAASATPVTDGENVYVFFKDLGLVSYDAAGQRRWAVPLGPFSNNMGLAASPILADGLLILQIDQTTGSYLAAFDPATGAQVWKVARAEGDSWATPVHFTPPKGTRAILTAGSGQFGAHAAKDGVRLWSQPGLSPALVASPVLAGDTAFVFGYGYEGPAPFGDALAKYDRDADGMLQTEEFGEDAWLLQVSRQEGDFKSPVTLDEWNEAFRKITAPSSLLAIRLSRDGALPGVQPRILWRLERNFIGVVPSPLVLDGVVYIVRNGGILTSYDAETGRILKTGRLESALGAYSASPVTAEGRIYLASEDGQVTVVRAGREWTVLGSSDLGEPVFATPALLASRVYVRTASALYAFGK
nr:PQQ-binding-like beta-propeller repeat protein [Acidobacteriota bacterium]